MRWLTGMFVGCTGALMLLVPHRFSGPGFAMIRPELTQVAIAFFVVGTALAIATPFAANKLLLGGLHGLVGLAWLLLAAGFVQTGNWSGSIRFIVFGLGTLVSPLLVKGLARRQGGVRDAFAVLLGIATFVNGIFFAVTGGQAVSAALVPVRVVGFTFCVVGLVLVAVQLVGRASPLIDWTARVLVTGSFAVLLLFSSLQVQSWVGVMYYAGFGLALLLAPLVGAFMPSDPESLWTQLGVAVMLAAAVPLVAVVTIICNRQQDMVTSLSLRSAQRIATVLADDLSRYADAQRGAASRLAATPGLPEMSPAQVSQLLARFQSLYPDVAAISVYDATGRLRAGSSELPGGQTQAGKVVTVVDSDGRRSSLVFTAPILNTQSEFAGSVAMSVPSRRWLDVLQRTSGAASAYLVDGQAHLIAQTGEPPISPADLSGTAPVRALMQGPNGAGSLDYERRTGRYFAGYARIANLGGVVVEAPAQTALAAVYTGRELTLKQLVLIVVLAGILGLLVARSLSAPLGELARAAGELASGDHTSPLPRSRISELRRLAIIFGAMRESLRRQTEERERAEQANRELLVRELEARAQTQTLEQLNRFKDELLENVAHELRTPLSSIRAYSELLLTYDPDADTQREFTTVINDESERLTRLLNDVLDLTKIQSGKLQWHVTDTRLPQLLEEAARKHAVLIRGKGLNFEVDVAGGLPVIQADADRLMQVVDNLLSNATKFTKAGEITLRAWLSADEVRVVVSDTGIGIPAQEQGRVFEKFHQVTQGLTDKPAGTGLGLAICKEIVEYHGGRIWLESELGHGSTFAFSVPCAGIRSQVLEPAGLPLSQPI